jgi:hypothetical protein
VVQGVHDAGGSGLSDGQGQEVGLDGGALEDYVVETVQEVEKKFENVVGQDSLTRFDQPKKKNNNKNKKRKPSNFKNAPKKD